MNILAATTNYSAAGSGTTLTVRRLIDGTSYVLEGFKTIRQVIAAPSLINQVLLLCGNNEVVSVNIVTGQRIVLTPESSHEPTLNSIAIDPNSNIYAVRAGVDQNGIQANKLVILTQPDATQAPKWGEIIDFNNTFSAFDEVIDSRGQTILAQTPDYQISAYLLGLDGSPFLIATERDNNARFRVFEIIPIDSNSASDGAPGSQPKLKIAPISATLTSPLSEFTPVAVNATTFLYKEGASQWKIWASARDVKDTSTGNFIDFDTNNSFWSQRPENAKVLQQLNSASKIAVDQLLGFHTDRGSFSATDILQVQPGAAGVQATKLNSDTTPDKQLTATILQSGDSRLVQLEIHTQRQGKIASETIGLPLSLGHELINASMLEGGDYLITFLTLQDRRNEQYALNPASLDGNDIAIECYQIIVNKDAKTISKFQRQSYELTDEILMLADGSREGLLQAVRNLNLFDQPNPERLLLHRDAQPLVLIPSQITDLLNTGDATAAVDSYSFLGSSLTAGSAGSTKDPDGFNPGFDVGTPVGIKLPPKYGSIKDAFNYSKEKKDEEGNVETKEKDWYVDFSIATGLKQKLGFKDGEDEWTKKDSVSLNAGLKVKFGQPSKVQSLYQKEGKSINTVKKELAEYESKLATQTAALNEATLKNTRLRNLLKEQESYNSEIKQLTNGRLPTREIQRLAEASANAVDSLTKLAAARAAIDETKKNKPDLKVDKKEFKVGLSGTYTQNYGYATWDELLESLKSFDFFNLGPHLKTKELVAGIGIDFKFPWLGNERANIFGKISMLFGARFVWAVKKALESLPSSDSTLEGFSGEQQLTFDALDNIFQWVTADGTPIRDLTEAQRKSLRLNDIRWNILLNPLNILPPQLIDTIGWIDDKTNAANEFLTTIPPMSWIVQLQQQLDAISGDSGNGNSQNYTALISEVLTGDRDIFFNDTNTNPLYGVEGLIAEADYLRLYDMDAPGLLPGVGNLVGDVELTQVLGDFRIKNLGVGFEARLLKALVLSGEAGAYLDFLTDFHTFTKGSFGINLAFELAALIVTVGAKAKIQLFSWDTTQHSTLTSNLIFKDNNLSADYRNILARENFSLDLDQSFQVINRYGLNDQSSLVFDATLIEGETAYGVLRLPKNVQTSQSGLISELYLYQGKVDNSTRQITWNFKVNTHLGTGLYDRANIAGYDLIFNRPVIILHGINDDSEEFRSAIEASTSSSGKISANLASYSDRLYTLSNSQNPTDSAAMGSEISLIQTLVNDNGIPYAVLYATSLPNESLSTNTGYQQGSVIINAISFYNALAGGAQSIANSKSVRLVNSTPSAMHFGKSISATHDSIFILEDNQGTDSTTIGWHVKDLARTYQNYGKSGMPSCDLADPNNTSAVRLPGIFPDQRTSQYKTSQIYALADKPDYEASSGRYLTSYLAKDSATAVNHSTYLSLSNISSNSDLIISNLSFVNGAFGSDVFSGSMAADVSGTTDTLFVGSEGYVGIISGDLSSKYPILPQPQVIKDSEAYKIADYYLDFADFRIAAQFELTNLDPAAPITKDNLITAVLLADHGSLNKLNGDVVNELIDSITIERISEVNTESPVSLDLSQSNLAALFAGTSPLTGTLSGVAQPVNANDVATYKYARIGFATNNNPLEVAIVNNSVGTGISGLSLATNDDDNRSICYLIFDSTIKDLVEQQETMYLEPLLDSPRTFRQGEDGYAFSRGSKVAYTSLFYAGKSITDYIAISDPTASKTASNQGAIYFIKDDENFRRYVNEKSSQGTPIIDPAEYVGLDVKHGYILWGSHENDYFGTDLEVTAPLTSSNVSTQLNNIVLAGSPGAIDYSQLSQLMNNAPTSVNDVDLPLPPGVTPALTKLVTIKDSTTLEGGTSLLAYVVNSPTSQDIVDSTIYVRNLNTGSEQVIQKPFVGEVSGVSDIIWDNQNQPHINITALDSKTGQSHILTSSLDPISLTFGELKVDFNSYVTALPTPSIVADASVTVDATGALLQVDHDYEVIEGNAHNVSVSVQNPAAAKIRVTTLDKTAFAGKDYVEHKSEYLVTGQPHKFAIPTIDQPYYSGVRALDLVVEVLDASGVGLGSSSHELKVASDNAIKLQNIGISNSVSSSRKASNYIGLSATSLSYYTDPTTRTAPAAFLVGKTTDNVITSFELVVSSFNKGKDYNLDAQSSGSPLFAKINLNGTGFSQVVSAQNTIALATSNGEASQVQFYTLPTSAAALNSGSLNSPLKTLNLQGGFSYITTFDYNNKHYYTVSDPAASKLYVIDAASLGTSGVALDPARLPSISLPSAVENSGSFGLSVAFGKINNISALVIGEPLANPVGSASSDAYGGAVHVVAIDDILARKEYVDTRITTVNAYPKTITDESADNYLTSYGAALGTSIAFANLFDKKDVTNTTIYHDQEQLIIGAPLANIGSSDNIPGTILVLDVKDQDSTTSRIFVNGQTHRRLDLDINKFIYTDQSAQDLKGTALLGAESGSGIGFELLNAGKFTGHPNKDVLALPSPSTNLYSGAIIMYAGNNAIINTVGTPDSVSSPLILNPQSFTDHAFAYIGTAQGASSQFSQSPTTLAQYVSATGSYSPTFNTESQSFPSLFASNYSLETSGGPGGYYLYGAPYLTPGDIIQSTDLGGSHGKVLTGVSSPGLPIRVGDLNLDGFADLAFYPVVSGSDQHLKDSYTVPIIYGQDDNDLTDYEANASTVNIPYIQQSNLVHGKEWNPQSPIALNAKFLALSNIGNPDELDTLSFGQSPIINYPERLETGSFAAVSNSSMQYSGINFSWQITPTQGARYGSAIGQDYDNNFYDFEFERNYTPYMQISSILAGYQTRANNFFLLTKEGNPYAPQSNTYAMFGIHGFFDIDGGDGRRIISGNTPGRDNLLDWLPNIPSQPGSPSVPDRGFITDSFDVGTKTTLLGYLASPDNSVDSFIFTYDYSSKRVSSQLLATTKLTGNNASAWMSSLANKSVISSADDFNNDGLIDIVSLSGFNQTLADANQNPFEYSVFYGDKIETFDKARSRTIIPLPNQPAVSIASVGDTNGDGASSLVVSPLTKLDTLAIANFNADEQFSFLLYPTTDNINVGTLRKTGSSGDDLFTLTPDDIKNKPTTILLNYYQGSDAVTLGQLSSTDVSNLGTLDYLFVSLGSGDDVLNLDASWLSKLLSVGFSLKGDQGVDTLNITGTTAFGFELSNLLPHLQGFEFINLPKGSYSYDGMHATSAPTYINAPYGSTISTAEGFGTGAGDAATFNAATFNRVDTRGNLFLSSAFDAYLKLPTGVGEPSSPGITEAPVILPKEPSFFVDANRDGVQDSVQDNVIPLSISGSAEPSDLIALVSLSDIQLDKARFTEIDPDSISALITLQPGISINSPLPVGIANLFSNSILGFDVQLGTPGGTTTVSIYASESTLSRSNSYIRFNYHTNRFEDFVDATGSPLYRFRDADNNGLADYIELMMTDGDPAWDGDGVVNGTVVDPGFIAFGELEFYGSNSRDYLTGNLLANTLRGSNGDDWLIGGLGADVLIGGKGKDRYVFVSADESTASARDTVSLSKKDRFVFSSFDADSTTDGQQTLSFIGNQTFSGVAGQLRATRSLLEADTNGDSLADFAVNLRRNFLITERNLVL